MSKRAKLWALWVIGMELFTVMATAFYFLTHNRLLILILAVFAVICIFRLFMNRLDEIYETERECRKETLAIATELDASTHDHRQQVEALLQERERLASELAALVQMVYRRRNPDDALLHTVRLEMIRLVMDMLNKGVPATALTNFVSPAAISDVVQSAVKGGTFSVTDGPWWQQAVGQFLLEDAAKNEPSAPPSTTAS